MNNKLQISLAAALAVVSGVAIFVWLTALEKNRELVTVLALKHDVTLPIILTNDDFIKLAVPRESLPSNYLSNPTQAAGKIFNHSAYAKYILTANDFANHRDSTSESMLVPAGMIGMVLPANWLAAPLPRLKAHDLVSVYVAVATTKQSQGGAGQVVSAAEVLAVRAEKDAAPQGIFIALTPVAAEQLLRLKASQLPLLVVVESGLASPVPILPTVTSSLYGS